MQQQLRFLSEAKDLKGKKVLLRLDLNVPILQGEVRDDFRMKRALPTVKFLKDAGARTVIISHLESEETDSLSRIASYISDEVSLKAFVADMENAKTVIEGMRDGDVVMLENLRKHPGEKTNDPIFAGRLANLADMYVNDAFSVSHRGHASVVSIPRLLPSYAGLLFAEEVRELSRAFEPEHPFLFVVAGLKFETKLPLVEKFLDVADHVFVGGALANDVFKEKGLEVGKSVVAKNPINLKHIERNPKLIIPSDVVVSNPAGKEVKTRESVAKDDMILDAGPQTVVKLSDLLSDVRFVVWNGPIGDYTRGFSEGTESLARALVESGAKTVLGGGDTIAVVSKLGILDRFSFVSTGGGAMLDFLAKGTLPGIEALRQSS